MFSKTFSLTVLIGAVLATKYPTVKVCGGMAHDKAGKAVMSDGTVIDT